ncbi:hypothetical protein F7P69_11190 [Cellulosimicrobium funkei]|nr:hypothetical protein [Cellulosimicrobium funkei]
MFTLPSALSGSLRRADSRPVLRAALLALLVALGFMAMHTMHTMHATHGQAAGPGADVVQGVSVHDGHPDHAAGSPARGHPGDGRAESAAGVGMHHSDGTASGMTETASAGGGATGDLNCEGCPAAHLGLAMTCLVALLLVLFVLTPPRLLQVSFGQRLRAGPSAGLAHQVAPRPPSLQILCISRT